MSTVRLRGLGKIYSDGIVAVSDVDLDIGDGEFFVLVGPSGCGKTSLLRMIAGLESISSGDVFVDGERVNDVPTNTRDLSMVFQGSTLYPHLTVRENLGFPLVVAGHGKAATAKRVAEVADLLGLSPLLDSLPHALSGGERQRVALGRAIARQPQLLLMDEPMSNLDAKLRTELRAGLLMLQRRLGITTVYVTHDQVEAMALGDRLAVMWQGRVLQVGRPVDVYRRPVNTFVAQALGSPVMNLIVARVIADAAGVVLQLGAHRVVLDDVDHRWSGWADLVGKDVVVGIRPEAFHVDPDGEFVLSLRFHEQIGSTQWIHAVIDAEVIDTTASSETADRVVVAAIEGRRPVSLWKPLRLAVDHSQISIFDRETGVLLDLRCVDVIPGRPPDSRTGSVIPCRAL